MGTSGGGQKLEAAEPRDDRGGRRAGPKGRMGVWPRRSVDVWSRRKTNHGGDLTRPTTAEDGRSAVTEIAHGRPRAAAKIARIRPRWKMDGRPQRGSHVAGHGGRWPAGRGGDRTRPAATGIAIVRDRPWRKMDGRRGM